MIIILLKLAGVIDWPWAVVLIPLWVYLALFSVSVWRFRG